MTVISLPILALHMQFEAVDTILPPHAIGAMWRGVLGRALRTRDQALYAAVFEPKAHGKLLKRYEDAPTPFVLEATAPADLIAQPGDPIDLWIKVFGRTDPAPILDGIIEAAAHGLGRGRGRAKLLHCVSTFAPDDPDAPLEAIIPAVPEMPDAVHVALISPLRLRIDGEMMEASAFSVTEWIAALVRRLELLTALYGDQGLPKLSVPNIPILQAQLWTMAMHRWSARQKREIDMSGVMGTFMLPMKGIEALWPVLWIGQWTQIGSATNAGLGAYRLVPV